MHRRPYDAPQAIGWHAGLSVPAWLVNACLAAAAVGQSLPTNAPRYGMPPLDAVAEPVVDDAGKPLISYRRDDAKPAELASTAGENGLRAAGASVESGNPLRPNPEPPPESYPLPAEPSTPSIGDYALPLPTSQALPPLPEPEPAASNPFPAAAPIFRYDGAIEPASHETPRDESGAFPATDITRHVEGPETRRLAPPSIVATAESEGAGPHQKTGASPFSFSKLESLSTAGAGLAIVVGLFLICMWLLRRGGGKTSGVLPVEAFAVLGRAPLTAQTFAHLLRVGNKLVLVAVTPGGAQPLTEVTDPQEVDRLTALCASGRGHGPAAEFQQVLAQLAREPARGFLGGEATAGRRRA